MTKCGRFCSFVLNGFFCLASSLRASAQSPPIETQSASSDKFPQSFLKFPQLRLGCRELVSRLLYQM